MLSTYKTCEQAPLEDLDSLYSATENVSAEIPRQNQMLQSMYIYVSTEKQDFALLEHLAKDSKTKEILAKIKSEDIPEIRDVWIEEFFKCAKCPKCNGKFIIKEKYSTSESPLAIPRIFVRFAHEYKCEKCNFELRF